MDPVIHAQMTNLVMRQKELEKERAQLTEDETKWARRVELATQKGMHDLAGEAGEKLDEVRARLAKVGPEIDMIEQEKSFLRVEARRPSGDSVLRAEMMVEQAKMAGLDPDAAKAERELEELEAEVMLDFGNETDD